MNDQWNTSNDDGEQQDQTPDEQQDLDNELEGGLDDMFEEADDEFGSLTVLVFGDAGTGKTHFTLTGGDPIYAIDTEGPLSKIQSKMDNMVKVKEVQYYNDNNEIDGTKSMNVMTTIGKKLYSISRSNNQEQMPETIVIDSMSDVWYYAQRYMKEEVYREHGRDQTYQFDWTIANNQMRTLTKQLMNSDVDVIMTAQEQQEYDDSGNAKDSYSPKAWKKLPYQVDVIMRLEEDIDIDTETGTEERIRRGHIQKCRPSDDLVGEEIKNPTMKKLKEEIYG